LTTESPVRTAFITGASSGLGAEYAHQLAAKGYSLVLTARREDRLQQLGASLQSKYGIHTQIQPADLSKLSEIEKLITLVNSIKNLDLLVNNAGFGTVGRFHKVDANKELAMVNVHMLAPVLLSRAALSGMIARGRGAIINVASLAGLIPIRNVLYHSTKSFLISFSEALYAELRGTPIHVQALCPGFILTEFHDTIEYSRFSRRRIPKYLWMTPDKVVSVSLYSLQQGKLICIPGRIYHFAGLLSRNSLSTGVIRFIAQLILQKRKPS
jgi:short-subunit dehydrogenase